MADMRSYVCTFADCKVPDLLFPSRHAWYSHEIAFHRRKWFCISSCSLQFDSRESFDSHIKAIHVSLLRTADAETHGAYSRQLPTQQATSCPFCGEDLQDAKRAKSHIGHHQEQLGLWPLRTMREFEDDDNQQEGDDEEANGEVDGSESEDKEEEMGERQGLEKKIIADGKPFQHIGEIKTPRKC